jgi:drug/metabolite transporter (DMT)-like permease
MQLWIWITLLAATSQNIRTAIQSHMKDSLGDYGASAIRFIYAIPFAWIWFLCVIRFSEQSFPSLNLEFALWLTVGGLAQIIFTVLLVKLFSFKNFVVGVAFSKTEVLLAALMEAVFLSVAINLQFGFAILIGTVAVIMLSLRGNLFSISDVKVSLGSRSTVIGLLAGFTLSISVVAFRAAINSLDDGDSLLRASAAGAIGVVGQALVMLIYLATKRKSELYAVFRLWKFGIAAGFFAAISTAAWFIAFALHTAAPVRAIGQFELLISIGITLFVFRQKINRIELAGIFLLGASILLVILNS